MKKFSFDVHGVIDATPELFAFLTNLLVEAGHEVHILTGGSWTPDLENQLKEMNIKWTHTFSVYDNLIQNDTPTRGHVEFPDGTVQKKFVDGYWDRVKGEYCKEHGIDLHIDDTLIYNDFFTTPFSRFWSHNNKPKAKHKDVRLLD